MMLDRPYSTATLDDLASLVVHARPADAPQWQISGARAALLKAADRPGTVTLAQLAAAALTVAADPSARTPEPICWDGPWWNTQPTATTTPAPAWANRCAVCDQPKNAHPIANDIHDFESNRDHTKAAQATNHHAHAADARSKIGTHE